MADDNRVPRKYQDATSPITGSVSGSTENKATATIATFPEDVKFNGMKEAEEIILVVRRSPFSMIWKFIAFFVLLFAPIFIIVVIRSMGYESGSLLAFSFGVSFFFLILAFTYGLDTYVKWFYSINMITDERIVDVDFSNILYHRYSEASLEQIQDVTHTVNGVLGSFFDYGTVYIQTAASRPEFEFENVPKPREVQEVLVNILEMKERGDI